MGSVYIRYLALQDAVSWETQTDPINRFCPVETTLLDSLMSECENILIRSIIVLSHISL